MNLQLTFIVKRKAKEVMPIIWVGNICFLHKSEMTFLFLY